jgi:hypothetical protein
VQDYWAMFGLMEGSGMKLLKVPLFGLFKIDGKE